jgi:hypothetical protein
VYLNATKAYTKAAFEDPKQLAKAIPAPRQWLQDSTVRTSSVIFTNYTGIDVVFVLSGTKKKVKNISSLIRSNLNEIESVVVEKGESIHVPVQQRNYHLSGWVALRDDQNKKVRPTALGEDITNLYNRSIVVSNSPSNGDVVFKLTEAEQAGYFTVINQSRNQIHLELSRDPTAYVLSGAALEEDKRSRLNDTGRKTMKLVNLAPGATWVYYHPQVFYARICDPDYDPDTDREYSPTQEDYIDLAEDICVRPGQVAVGLIERGGEGYMLCSYDQKEIKLVDDNLAVTIPEK